jgi:predicted alpha/beta superfamily hydrolase
MMIQRFFLSVTFCLTLSFVLCSQLTIKITSVPSNTPSDATIYLAGTMNGWNPGSTQYAMTKLNNTEYTITFTPSTGGHKFKFTRGSWATVEGNAQGSFIPDRTATYEGSPKTVELTIAGWEGASTAPSTASAQVRILSDTFLIPQLNRKRRIWMYLPKDYNTSAKTYPVLYMHDGQNLFDKKTSFSGEWGVDESLDSLFDRGDYGCIVVGIDNGGSNRLNEYSPWVHAQYGGGQGDEYIDFIVKTLKPYIDKNYRTLADRDHTGMMGSSMGGLISMYAGIAYPEVFGKTGALSSSYWFSQDSYKQVSDTGVKPFSYFYLLAGAQEGGNQIGDMEKMNNTLKNAGASEHQVYKISHADGKHSEWYWAREFPAAYKWLFNKNTTATNSFDENIHFEVKYEESFLKFTGPEHLVNNNMKLYDLSGKELLNKPIGKEMRVEISNLNLINGIYLIQVGKNSIKIYLNQK